MELSQEIIDEAIRAYNTVTRAHKKAPVERYIQKQLAAGEVVQLSSGKTRWSSALEFSGTPQDVKIHFRINPALPDTFREQLSKMKEAFENELKQTTSA